MTKTLVTLIFAFLIVFAAGAAVGMRRGAAVTPHVDMGGPPELSQELNLTDDQREKMRAIWQPIVSGSHKRQDQRHAIEAQRDQAIEAILTPDQLGKYKTIMDAFHAQMAAMDAQRHKDFAAAQDATRAILNPDQRAKYEELLKARHPPGPSTQPDGGTSATTQPDANFAAPTTQP